MKTKFSTMTPEQISYQRSDIENPLRSKGFFTEYNSFQEFASEFDWKSKQFDDGHSDRRKAGITTVGSWEGSWIGESKQDVQRHIAEGCTELVADAEAMLQEINSKVSLKGLRESWTLAPEGAFPCVPSHLAGSPEAMLQRQRNLKVASQQSTLKVYYSPTVHAGVKPKAILQRGTVVLATVLALSKVRPVELYYYSVTGKGDVIIRIQTNPMKLSETAWVITSPGVFRGMSFKRSSDLFGWEGRRGQWAGGSNVASWKTKVASQRKALELSEADLLIPGAQMQDMGLLKDPVGYINDLLDAYREGSFKGYK